MQECIQQQSQSLKMNNKGFTLVELLIVIGVFCVLISAMIIQNPPCTPDKEKTPYEKHSWDCRGMSTSATDFADCMEKLSKMTD